MATASRTDLLAWLNELLQINYTKVEQCGTGGAYCQVLDSIYGDVPMSKVKMNAKHEYEYIANYKVMQNVFKAKKLDKVLVLILELMNNNIDATNHQPIPIERLVKCKMQDNLEFLQWIKRFWDSNYGGQGYDAVGRRKGVPAEPPASIAPTSTSRAGTGGLGVGAGRSGGKTPIGGHRSGSAMSNEAVQLLQTQVKELSANLEGLEKERDFYFEKLRDIEILVQQQMEALEAEGKDDVTLRDIQKILYSTEEGFEVPDAGVGPVDEEETF